MNICYFLWSVIKVGCINLLLHSGVDLQRAVQLDSIQFSFFFSFFCLFSFVLFSFATFAIIVFFQLYGVCHKGSAVVVEVVFINSCAD